MTTMIDPNEQRLFYKRCLSSGISGAAQHKKEIRIALSALFPVSGARLFLQ
jgi:hypothetical protein